MDQRFKALGAWLVTYLSSQDKAFQPDDIKGISPAVPMDSDDSDGEPLVYSDSAEPSAEDVARDLREQAQFR